MSGDANIIGAIEAGGTKFVCAVADPSGDLLDRIVLPTTAPDETLAAVADYFERAAAQFGALCAVGVASFGPVGVNPAAPDYGIILPTPKAGWTGASFPAALARFGVPVIVDSDVNGAALGEYHLGAGRGASTLAYVTVGTGIGAGVVSDGRPLSGLGHFELGHIRPPHDRARDPFPGRCPFHGDCLEGLACGPAIIDRWGAPLSELPDGHDAIDLEADYLSHLALTIILAHMPERIVFGGGVMKTPGLIEAIRAETRTLLGGYVSAPPLNGDLSSVIVAPALGDLAGIRGAALLAIKHLGESQPWDTRS